MSRPTLTAVHVVHRLLFDALLEMRAQGREQHNRVVYHLADLFHTVALAMEQAARGERGYEDVLELLRQRAEEKGCGAWVREQISRMEERLAARSVDRPAT